MGHHTCCNKQKVRRGLWSPEEDEKLIKYITTHGHGCWSSVPKLAGLQRCGKSCRLRWINYLRPDLKRGSFSPQEESLIIELHRLLGNRWSQIAKQLPGRTDNEVKNFWNSSIKKKLMALEVNNSNPIFPLADGTLQGIGGEHLQHPPAKYAYNYHHKLIRDNQIQPPAVAAAPPYTSLVDELDQITGIPCSSTLLPPCRTHPNESNMNRADHMGMVAVVGSLSTSSSTSSTTPRSYGGLPLNPSFMPHLGSSQLDLVP